MGCYNETDWYRKLAYADRDKLERQLEAARIGLQPLDPALETQICGRFRERVALRIDEEDRRAAVPKWVTGAEWNELVKRMISYEVDVDVDQVMRREIRDER